MTQERRRHLRIKKNLPLKISTGDFDIVTETENISCVGAYCKTDKYLVPMTKLKVLILLPVHSRKSIVNKKVECEGVVVRTESSQNRNHQYKIAIFFNDIKNKDIKKISDYVDNHFKSGEIK